MSNVINLTQKIRKVSQELSAAREAHDEELIEELEDILYDLQDELDSLSDDDERLSFI